MKRAISGERKRKSCGGTSPAGARSAEEEEDKMKQTLLRLQESDDVAIALVPLRAGEDCGIGGRRLMLRQDIPFGHKVALHGIEKGAVVRKYGAPIGYAKCDIREGEHVHTHNLHTTLSTRVSYQHGGGAAWPVGVGGCEASFEGYPRKDGRAGTRNELWIIPTVGCINATALRLAEMARARFGDRFDDVRAYTHNMGCSQLGEDQETTMKLLAGLIRNPNAGGVLVLSLGCENNHLEVFRPYLGEIDADRVKFLVTQDVEDEFTAGMALLEELNAAAGGKKREPVPVSKLVVGFKCGGSDAFSGLTANPLCGRLCDRIVRNGGACVLTEVPEMFGAEHLLMERCVSEGVFQKTVDLINGYKDYFIRYGQVIYENPSPGNKAGGISTLEEKSLGCVQKGGSAPITDVLGYGESVNRAGLNLLNGSGNDQVSCTNLACSGATLICFTTGRGNPYGAPLPTVKIASNSVIAGKKPQWIDFNAGRLLEASSRDEVDEVFWRYILDVASGRAKTRNEVNGHKEISIFKDGVVL